MGIDIRGSATEHSARRPAASGAAAAGRNRTSAEAGVTALFAAHSLGLIRLAHIMLGDRSSAEDVVQEAFCGLYRRWPQLTDQAKALPYVRSSVLNGCRTVLLRGQGRGIHSTIRSFGDFTNWAAAYLDGAGSRGLSSAKLQRHWAHVFVTCGRPAIAVQERLQSARRTVFLTGYTGDLTAHWHAVVRATATGTALATVSPPRPYRTFSWVSGAADDRTFVLAAQPWVPGASPTRNANQLTKFFLLHFDPATGAAPLTALPITEKQGYRVIGLALSPDGSKLAVVLATPHEPQQSRKIQIFTLATGSQHDWTWAGRGWVGTQSSLGQPLSWAADGRTLAFQQWTGEHLNVRLLDTAAAGSSLRSARPAVAILSSNNDDSNSLLTPDGRTVIYAPAQVTQGNTLHSRFREKLNFAEFSASTGKLVRILDPWSFSLGSGGIPYQQVLWTNSSGATLIVISPPGTSPAGHWVRHSIQPVLGVLTGNHFTPIPGSPTANQNITSVAW